ncbi:MAG: hypothetical protein B2I18_05665 [Cuniculiplasma sp. C_DKE]|jgi:hypothetical protein|uniref:Nucleotidyltransferase n=1 Tax=Cuniculiplasma divulgatum TaxID=1673428 RepID=A0A1N5TJA3_9ARCH|nr:MAG: hypothetical protein AMDU5_GPLC00010G0083 [Thermoplasmatales archaeon Gpl]OWP54718.1 MAG: hypothetical protein B2I18_05665 [Cuniculiplasma sp. C_DKE]SIM48085.1 hypothetical protein CSP5_0582 [Cuniculiplasma divulgatum]SJK84432.1 hypothetical protein CPM_0556 [Cuniculiplasma divulgatum]
MHVGSTDIDLIVDPDIVDNNEYQTIVELIEQSGRNQLSGNSSFLQERLEGKTSSTEIQLWIF